MAEVAVVGVVTALVTYAGAASFASFAVDAVDAVAGVAGAVVDVAANAVVDVACAKRAAAACFADAEHVAVVATDAVADDGAEVEDYCAPQPGLYDGPAWAHRNCMMTLDLLAIEESAAHTLAHCSYTLVGAPVATYIGRPSYFPYDGHFARLTASGNGPFVMVMAKYQIPRPQTTVCGTYLIVYFANQFH